MEELIECRESVRNGEGLDDMPGLQIQSATGGPLPKILAVCEIGDLSPSGCVTMPGIAMLADR
jgi:hypothetical protein